MFNHLLAFCSFVPLSFSLVFPIFLAFLFVLYAFFPHPFALTQLYIKPRRVSDWKEKNYLSFRLQFAKQFLAPCYFVSHGIRLQQGLRRQLHAVETRRCAFLWSPSCLDFPKHGTEKVCGKPRRGWVGRELQPPMAYIYLYLGPEAHAACVHAISILWDLRWAFDELNCPQRRYIQGHT